MVTIIENSYGHRVENRGQPALDTAQQYAQRGMAYFDAGDYNAAWHCFNEAIKINPHEQHYYYMRASCSANLSDFNAAIENYNAALKLAQNDQDKGWIHFDLAVLYGDHDDDDNALYHLTTAARLGLEIAQDMCNQFGIPY